MEHLKNLAVGLAAVGALVLVMAFLVVTFPWSFLLVTLLVLSYIFGDVLRETGW